MWHEPELPRELEAMIDDDTLDRFTVAGEPEECAERLRAIARTFPEITGFRVKLPRPVREATLESYRQSIIGMAEVIALVREAPRRVASAAFTV
jgi:alkanesulfonate monooxygenase SsuD/methylene tetrahydromethanopterin reductase-like flavin-dependent oxidoreductase (luciferase family)